MRVARISIAEFKSESEINRFVDDADRTFWDLYPTAEACYQVRTGPTSIINVTIYPNEEAANKTLSGRNQFVENHRDSIIDTFFHVGEVAFSKSAKNKSQEKKQINDKPKKIADHSSPKGVATTLPIAEKDAELSKQVAELSSEIAQVKAMLSQVLEKL